MKSNIVCTWKEEIELGNRPKVEGTTIKQKTPFGSAFITLNNLKSKPLIPFESFITIGKGGKDINAIAEGYGRLLSLTFKKGASVEEVAEQLKGISGESASGIGPSKVKSLPDAIAIGLLEANSQITGKPIKNGKTEGTINQEADQGTDQNKDYKKQRTRVVWEFLPYLWLKINNNRRLSKMC